MTLSPLELFFNPESNQAAITPRPFIIAGPCGAESELQVHATVDAISHLPIHMVRAGIWKPRTRPDSFEGRGTEALRWLKEATTKYNLPCTVEVATAAHVEAAVIAGIDVLWIGARTTVSPFMMQDIADALKGIDIPVMVKNPVNPDLALWLGAIERLQKLGVQKIAAIHRGFSSYENNIYRNKPNWEIPIEFRRQMKNIPMICDPSHISGSSSKVGNVAQTALDINYDGLMIETHIDPPKALSDAAQQLTPRELELLLAKLKYRAPQITDVFELAELNHLRTLIDTLDTDLIEILAKRMSISREIGELKKKNDIAIFQPERWDQIVKTRTKHGVEKELNREFLLKLVNILHEESINNQARMMNSLDQFQKKT
ncbi:MAG: bifunctional 3-deoxy-7-phosphoheptulonate synthase/chorismate mutase type II [Bacteroidetes bacterium]|nr:bifunctional 3-deoxy-7-phosphoheptulonate synthase/chorismate mutase type II [Bacteroidota bacterium]